MTRRSWRNLPMRVREVSIHEAAHGVIGEVLGWPVKYLRVRGDGAGFCGLRGEAPAPWVDVVVSAAGHAAEVWYRGGQEPSEYGAYYDRRDSAKVMEGAGVDKADSPFAVVEVERWLWPVFEDAEVGGAVRRVAKALATAKRQHLDRWEFLRAADFDYVEAETVGNVRRYCRRLVERVHLQHL